MRHRADAPGLPPLLCVVGCGRPTVPSRGADACGVVASRHRTREGLGVVQSTEEDRANEIEVSRASRHNAINNTAPHNEHARSTDDSSARITHRPALALRESEYSMRASRDSLDTSLARSVSPSWFHVYSIQLRFSGEWRVKPRGACVQGSEERAHMRGSCGCGGCGDCICPCARCCALELRWSRGG